MPNFTSIIATCRPVGKTPLNLPLNNLLRVTGLVRRVTSPKSNSSEGSLVRKLCNGNILGDYTPLSPNPSKQNQSSLK